MKVRQRMKRKLLCVPAGVIAVTMLLASEAFACTLFRGTFTIQGNASSGKVVATGTGTGMTQTVSGGMARATASGGSIKIWTDKDAYGRGLPRNTYYVRYYNGTTCPPTSTRTSCPGYTDHTHWSTDCMYGGRGVTLGTVQVNGRGRIDKQPAAFSLPTSTADVGPQESAVCISDNGGAFGNQAPLTIV